MNIFRKKYYIYPELQKPLIKFILASVLVVTLVQSIMIYWAMKWLEAKTQADISIVVDYRVLGAWRNLLYLSILVPMIMNFILGFITVLFVSNKFAGPLFRLERELDLFLSGQKPKLSVQFRENDYLHSLAKKINLLDKSS